MYEEKKKEGKKEETVQRQNSDVRMIFHALWPTLTKTLIWRRMVLQNKSVFIESEIGSENFNACVVVAADDNDNSSTKSIDPPLTYFYFRLSNSGQSFSLFPEAIATRMVIGKVLGEPVFNLVGNKKSYCLYR